MASRLAGRPSKLTEELIVKLCDHVRNGCPLSVAAPLCGISITSVHTWMQSPDPICVRFKEEVEKARAKDVDLQLSRWNRINHETTDFRAIQNYLSVVHKWVAPSKIEHSHTGSVEHHHTLNRPDLSKLDPEQLKVFIERENQNRLMLEEAEERTRVPDMYSHNTLELSAIPVDDEEDEE